MSWPFDVVCSAIIHPPAPKGNPSVTTLVDATPLPAADLSIRDLWPFTPAQQVFYAALGVVLLLAVVYCCIATRRYSATGTIEVQNESMGGMELSDVFNGQEVTTDAMTTGLDLETQADILKSDTLALQVIRELNLEAARFQACRLRFTGSEPGNFLASSACTERVRSPGTLASHLRSESQGQD